VATRRRCFTEAGLLDDLNRLVHGAEAAEHEAAEVRRGVAAGDSDSLASPSVGKA